MSNRQDSERSNDQDRIFDTDFLDLRGIPEPEGTIDSLLRADEEWNAAYHHRDPERLMTMLADDWVGFFSDGTIVFKNDLLDGMRHNPPFKLMFERHASLVFGGTGITRGTLYANGERVQSFLRVYAWKGGQWWAVSVQVVA